MLDLIIEDNIARLVLSRPEKHNAFDDALIAELIGALEKVAKDPMLRVLEISARGRSFCAGADLRWMERMAGYDREENIKDAAMLGEFMHRLYSLSLPTIGLVQGAAYGGGVGLAACCDILLAASNAKFCLSEVKLGLIPAVISPYIIRAMGAKRAQRLFLTAEVFSAEQALEWGLADYIYPEERLKEESEKLCMLLMKNGPLAMSKSKELVCEVEGKSIDQDVIDKTVQYIADQRASLEAKAGLRAFFRKTPPEWIK